LVFQVEGRPISALIFSTLSIPDWLQEIGPRALRPAVGLPEVVKMQALRFTINYKGAWKIRPILRPSKESVKEFL
jgi:hypothetical protein